MIAIVVNVSGTGKNAPEGGTVSLYLGSVGGTPIATSAAIAAGQNTATFNFTTGSSPFANAGPYSILARYNGNANVSAADSAAHALTLTQVTPTVTFNTGASTSSAALGASLTFEVNVTGSGSASPAGGTVSLYITDFSGAAIATSAAIGGGSNKATFAFTAGSAPFANAGSYSLVARYNGNTNVAAADSSLSTPLALTLTKATSTTTLSVSPSSVAFSTTQSYTFTAKVTPTTFGGQSGTVSFQDDVSGSFVEIGTGTVSLVAGEYVATFSTTFGAGTHHIRAVYAGNTNFSGSTSTPPILLGP